MAIVTGDRYLEKLVKFVEENAGQLIDGTLVLKLNPAGLHYVQSRLEALQELENLLSGTPIDYLRAYVSDLGDHRALEQLRRILSHLTSLKVVSVLPPPASRDPTPLSLLPFGRLRVLELRGCDLSTSAAKGLLEVRHTLEKIICHNSTDALRHVFASRIAKIKDSPQWNKLSFVSCACNRLVLMDESLQLLPAVETLDLSRNKFAKVDNLRKCTKLKHLDLGFNHLRSIAPLSGVSCHICKIVLRNNALTTLHGLEKLKSLEELDISYNIISNFSELGFLGGLPSLKNLWLEGNPICCARWYRAQVFSYFSHSDMLKLDGKEIETREFWKMQIIIASRQKQPASFGFYSPAKDGTEDDSSVNQRRRKVSRLVLIESEDDMYFSSDQESPSIDNEIRSNKENAISDEEAEIVDLINRVEHMKKERSILWLREFKEWMDHESENVLNGGTYSRGALFHAKENHSENHSSRKHHGESSKFALDSLQTSGDGASINLFKSDRSFVDTLVRSYGGAALPGMGDMNLRHKHQKSYLHRGLDNGTMQEKSFGPDAFSIQGGHRIEENRSESQLSAFDNATEHYSSSANPGSPPHYKVDILNRRHNLVEEILQLSADSYSIVSSDSNTSSSEDNLYDCGDSMDDLEVEQSCNEKFLYPSVGVHSALKDKPPGNDHARGNDTDLFDSHAKHASTSSQVINKNSNFADSDNGETAHFVNQEDNWMARRKGKSKPRRRVISLLENSVGKTGILEKSNDNGSGCEANLEDDQKKQTLNGHDAHKIINQKQSQTSEPKIPATVDNDVFSDDFVEQYFNANVADPGMKETCKNYVQCDCVLEPESLHMKREVVLLSSSEDKLYVLLTGVAFDGSGSILNLLGWHKAEDVSEVLVGIGLQVVRVYIDRGATYVFLTGSIEKSRQLLYTLQVFGPSANNHKCSFRSLEQIQVEFFEKQILGGVNMNIYQYSMVLFWHNDNKGESWLSRSLFVAGGHILVCIEDLKQFKSSLTNASSSPYFSLHSCCFIGDVSEMVIESTETLCVTLALENAMSKFRPAFKLGEHFARRDKKKSGLGGSLTWKLKWFSKGSLFNFVALLKAIRAGMTMTPLHITLVS